MVRQGFVCVALAILCMCTVATSGAQTKLWHPPVRTAPVCDTQELAEQWIALADSHTDAEIFDKINAGRQVAVCGILRIQFIPIRIVTKNVRMRYRTVSVIEIRMLAAQLPDLTYMRIPRPLIVYTILARMVPT